MLPVNVSVNLSAVGHSVSVSSSIFSTTDKMLCIPRPASLPPSRTVDKHPVLASPGCCVLFVVISSRRHVLYRVPGSHSLSPTIPLVFSHLLPPRRSCFVFAMCVCMCIFVYFHLVLLAGAWVWVILLNTGSLPIARQLGKMAPPPRLLHRLYLLRDSMEPHKPSSIR